MSGEMGFSFHTATAVFVHSKKDVRAQQVLGNEKTGEASVEGKIQASALQQE